MVKKRIAINKSERRIRVSSTGIRKMILPILSDSNYKYNTVEVNGMCLRIQKSLTDSSRRVASELNSIIILK